MLALVVFNVALFVFGFVVLSLQSVNSGSDVQSIFLDTWRQDHPDVTLNDVPGDLGHGVASGLDPNITLANAEFQLDRWRQNGPMTRSGTPPKCARKSKRFCRRRPTPLGAA